MCGPVGRKMDERNPDNVLWSQKSDDELVLANVEEAQKELTRRLKDALVSSQAATDIFNTRLYWLTWALVLIGLIQLGFFIYDLFK
jgi:hypothetical protein